MSKTKRHRRALSTIIFAAALIGATVTQAQPRASGFGAADNGGASQMANDLSDSAPATEIGLARRALVALKKLEANVIRYQSMSDFEGNRRLARVSRETFRNELTNTCLELEPVLAQLSDKKLRTKLTNALYSFRDGVFWWGRTPDRGVVTAAALALPYQPVAPADIFLNASAPYTVAIHWKQASKFLLQAEKLLNAKSGGKIEVRDANIKRV